MKIPSVILNNKIEMPVLGLGTFSLKEQEISKAIEMGYRHLDTAKQYQNESEVGNAVKKSGIKREDFFITTKIMRQDLRERKAKQTLENSLKLLQMDYVDMYLIHFPPEGILQTAWQDMEDLYTSGKIRTIGVSNYEIKDLEEIKDGFEILPAVNQICSHPYKKKKNVKDYCDELGIQVVAYSPIGGNSLSKSVLQDKVLNEIAQKYSLSVPQLVLKWDYQRGVVFIPRSSKENHMRENLEIFDGKISDEDMRIIDSLEERN